MDEYLADLAMGGEAEMNDEEPEEEPEEEEDDEEPDEESPLKRPAAAKGNPLKRPAAKKSEPAAKKPAGSAAKKPAAQEEVDEDEEEEVDADECDALRDRMKSRKFDKIFTILPQFIQKEFNDAKADKTGFGRKRQTEIINKTITRTTEGSLQVANVANMSFFQEMLQRRKTKYQKKFTHGPGMHIHLHIYA